MKKVIKSKVKTLKKDENSPNVSNIRELLYLSLFDIKNDKLEVEKANAISKMAKTFLETYKVLNNKYVTFKKDA